jgi:hypothetical protein
MYRSLQLDTQDKTALLALLKLPCFLRISIVQEIVLAKTLFVFIGSNTFPRSHLAWAMDLHIPGSMME